MRRSFFGTASSQRIDCQNEITEPKSRTFTPSQQLAMLILRKSELSKAVVAKLYHSTVRDGAGDYEFLVQERLANRKGLGHVLTPMGMFKADQFARELGAQLKLPQLRSGGTSPPRGSYQRQWHTQSWTQ